MIEILLENLRILENKPIEDLYYTLEPGSLLEVKCSSNQIGVVKKMLDNPGLVNSFLAYDTSKPGLLVINDGKIGYQVIYGDKEIVSEVITEDGELIAENTTTNGVTTYDAWNGSDVIPEGLYIPTPLLFYTKQGKELLSSFITVKDDTAFEYFKSRGRQRFKDAGIDFCESANKYFKLLDFSGELQDDGSVRYPKYDKNFMKSGDYTYLYYTSEGSGYRSLINILPELDYCKKTGKILVVPNYTRHLHPLVVMALQEIIKSLEISAIITREDY